RRLYARRRLRQVYRDGSAGAGRGVDLGMAAGLLGKAIDLAEPKARSLADILRGEEGLEGAVADLGQHARSRVGDDDCRILARGPVIAVRRCLRAVRWPRRDGETAARRHGVARIDREIEERRLELCR